MSTGLTITGVHFEYSGSLATGLVVSFKKSALKITPKIIGVIRNEIRYYCGRATATERGFDPKAKCDPLMAVSAPVVGSIV